MPHPYAVDTSFKRRLKKKPPEQQEAVLECIKRLTENPQRASLLGFLAHHRELPEPRNPLHTNCVKGPWRYVGDRRPT